MVIWMASQGMMATKAPKAAQPENSASRRPKACRANTMPPPASGYMGTSSQYARETGIIMMKARINPSAAGMGPPEFSIQELMETAQPEADAEEIDDADAFSVVCRFVFHMLTLK